MLVALMRYPIESFEVDTHFASISLALTFFSNGFCFVLWIARSAFPTHHLWQSITLGNRHLYHRLFDDLRADQVSRNLWLDHFLPGSPESTPIPAPVVISRASASRMISAALEIAGSIFSHLSGELLPFCMSENFTQNIVGHFDRRLVRIDVGPTVRVVC